MDNIQALITGVVQGLSEFLPISSSAHIVYSNEIYHLITKSDTLLQQNIQEEIFFSIIVHLATLFAVVLYFFGDLKSIFKNFIISIKNKNYKDDNFKTVIYIAIATVITGVIGLLIKEPVEKLVTDPRIISILLFITGVILFVSEKFYKGNKKINLKATILISIAQGLAIFPGFSRSGLTISTALFNGVDRVQAARFSFLMSIPIIIFASLVYPILELDISEIQQFNLGAMLIGFASSFIVGYLCVKYFMKLLGKLSLKIFAYYCLVASCVMFVVFQVCHHQ